LLASIRPPKRETLHKSLHVRPATATIGSKKRQVAPDSYFYSFEMFFLYFVHGQLVIGQGCSRHKTHHGTKNESFDCKLLDPNLAAEFLEDVMIKLPQRTTASYNRTAAYVVKIEIPQFCYTRTWDQGNALERESLQTS